MAVVGVWVGHLVWFGLVIWVCVWVVFGSDLGAVLVKFRWCLGLCLDWHFGGTLVDAWVGGYFNGSSGLLRCFPILVVGFGDGSFGSGWVGIVAGFH